MTLPVLLPVTPSAPTGRSCSTSSFSLPESRHFFTQPQTDRSGDWTDRMRWSDAPRAGRIWRVGSTTLREIGKTSTSSWSTAQSGSQPHAYTLATMCYRTCWHQKRYYKHASLIGGGLRASASCPNFLAELPHLTCYTDNEFSFSSSRQQLILLRFLKKCLLRGWSSTEKAPCHQVTRMLLTLSHQYGVSNC